MARESRRSAGAMDIRNIIGMLLTGYGVILLLMGLFADQALDRTGGVNANLIAGVVLAIVGVAFMTWAKLRPIVVPDNDGSDSDRRSAPH